MPDERAQYLDQLRPGVLHATAIKLQSSGVLLWGASGCGKSSLALQLMAFGAELISDDLTELAVQGDELVLRCPAPETAPFGIEARGLGLLAAQKARPAKLAVIVDLDHVSLTRLPEPKTHLISGQRVPVLQKVDTPAFPAMLLHYLRNGLMAQ